MLLTGGTNWDLNGRKSMPKGCKSVGRNLYEPHLFAPLKDTRIRLVVSSCNSSHTIFITEEGKALSLGMYYNSFYQLFTYYSFIDFMSTFLGRNEKGQLGVKDLLRRDIPTPIEGLPDHAIVNAATGRAHTLLLTGIFIQIIEYLLSLQLCKIIFNVHRCNTNTSFPNIDLYFD